MLIISLHSSSYMLKPIKKLDDDNKNNSQSQTLSARGISSHKLFFTSFYYTRSKWMHQLSITGIKKFRLLNQNIINGPSGSFFSYWRDDWHSRCKIISNPPSYPFISFSNLNLMICSWHSFGKPKDARP